MSSRTQHLARSTCFVQLRTGACVDLLMPDLTPVRLTDIATSLARLPRFLGHTRGACGYTVAQHSVHTAVLAARSGLQRELQAAALLRDAHEAFIGNIPTPVKSLLGERLATLEERLLRAVFARFGVPPRLATVLELRKLDLVALATERRDLLHESAWPWRIELPTPDPDRLEPWPEAVAHSHFLAAANHLGLLR